MSYNLKNVIIPQVVSPQYLELILFPTEQCNFRCSYCYENFALGKMKPDVINGIKNLLTRRMPELSHIKLTWFGGEPLSARDVVYEISTHALKLAHKNRVVYQSNMTTNGFLLNLGIATKLNLLGIKEFQVSLDGTTELHNTTRIRINGSSSFETIWKNLLNLRDSNLRFSVILRIHITRENYTNLFDLIDELINNFSGDTRFKIFFKAIENLGGPNANTIISLADRDKIIAINKLTALVKDKMEVVQLKNQDRPYICYAAQANSFVIRSDGTIGKCTVALTDHRNAVGKLMPDGTLAIDAAKVQPWLRGLTLLDEKAMECPLQAMPL